MIDVVYKIIFGALAVILSIIISLFITSIFLKKLREKVKKYIISNIKNKNLKKIISDNFPADEGEEIIKKAKEEEKEALIKSILIENRSSGLGWITKTVSLIELLVFGLLTLLILYKTKDPIAGVKIFGTFLGGWIGIKTLISHNAWSDPFVGKAYYYISLFGTLINIITAFAVGLFLHHFIF